MAVNIFEGTRRITKLVAVVWVVGVSCFTLLQGDPYITGTYYISENNRGMAPSHTSCDPWEFQQKSLKVRTKKGAEAHVTLCFPPETKKFLVTIPSGVKYAVTAPIVATEQEVMAYVQSEVAEFGDRLKKERLTGGSSASSKRREPWDDDPIVLNWEGQAFAEHVKNSLILSQADEVWVEDQWWVEWWEQVRQGLLVLVAGVVFLWVLTWSIGWIVRGFLGIPRGQDHKARTVA